MKNKIILWLLATFFLFSCSAGLVEWDTISGEIYFSKDKKKLKKVFKETKLLYYETKKTIATKENGKKKLYLYNKNSYWDGSDLRITVK